VDLAKEVLKGMNKRRGEKGRVDLIPEKGGRLF
jgi:hypothetical protein